MSLRIQVERFAYSERFKDEFQKLEPSVQAAARDALDTLLRHPQAKSLRLHPLTGLPKPTVWKIDVSNWGQIPIVLPLSAFGRFCFLAPAKGEDYRSMVR